MKKWMNLGALLAVCSIWTALPTNATEPDVDAKQKHEKAQQLLDKALYEEIYGNRDERDALLDQASKVAPDYAPVQWQKGKVFDGKEFIDVKDAIEKIASNPVIQKYQELRGNMEFNIENNLVLAQWCEKNKLPLQGRAHLAAVLRIDPENEQAHMLLGDTRVNGRWMSQAEMLDSLQRIEADFNSLNAWQKRLLQIQKQFVSKDPVARNSAKLALAAIDDPSVIMPLELIFSSMSEQAALAVVEKVADFDDDQAAQSLSRHAVFSPWKSVRDQACVALRNYDHFAFVPSMLSALRTKTIGMRWVAPDAQGQLVYRHAALTETQNDKQLVIRDTVYQRVAKLGGDRSDTLKRALTQLAQTQRGQSMAIEMQNMTTDQRNDRITTALTAITTLEVGKKPQDWWAWWNAENGVYMEPKEIRVATSSRTVRIQDRAPDLTQILKNAGKGTQSKTSDSKKESVSVASKGSETKVKSAQPTGSTQTRKFPVPAGQSAKLKMNQLGSSRTIKTSQTAPIKKAPVNQSARVKQTPKTETKVIGRERTQIDRSTLVQPQANYTEKMQNAVQRSTTAATFEFRPIENIAFTEMVDSEANTTDCLAAGTPVMTATGLRAIDKLSVGDLVLSKDEKTGQLAFKPVVRTTVRPKSQLVGFRIGQEWVVCSKGHPLWVSGSGWTKAEDLESGMLIHTQTGFETIAEYRQDTIAKTYNLEVEDFNSYFVGEAMLYSHDNTLRAFSNGSVPGLAK